MTSLEKGDDKIKKICEIIRKDTLDPAKEHAKEIIENAKIEADQIIKKANNEKEKILNEAKKDIEKEKKIFDSSLNISLRQAFEDLKSKIENELFSKTLSEELKIKLKDSNIIADIINRIVTAIEKQGINADISALVSRDTDFNAVNRLLLDNVIKKLKEHEVVLKDFDGGVKIKLIDMQLTLDITKESLKSLIADYIRADFRQKVFNL